MAVPILAVEKHWECPSCGRQHVTKKPVVTSELHHCAALNGMIAPFVEVESNAGIAKGSMRLVAVERGDFIGKEVGVRTDAEGKAIMAVQTERADGSHDTHVFAPAAYARLHGTEQEDA